MSSFFSMVQAEQDTRPRPQVGEVYHANLALMCERVWCGGDVATMITPHTATAYVGAGIM